MVEEHPSVVSIGIWTYKSQNYAAVFNFYKQILGPVSNLETCLLQCNVLLDTCRGIHYIPTIQSCQLLDYHEVYNLGDSPGKGTQIVYTMSVDKALARGQSPFSHFHIICLN